MYGCMDVWMYGCMDVWMDGWMDGYVCLCIFLYLYKYTHTHTLGPRCECVRRSDNEKRCRVISAIRPADTFRVGTPALSCTVFSFFKRNSDRALNRCLLCPGPAAARPGSGLSLQRQGNVPGQEELQQETAMGTTVWH